MIRIENAYRRWKGGQRGAGRRSQSLPHTQGGGGGTIYGKEKKANGILTRGLQSRKMAELGLRPQTELEL